MDQLKDLMDLIPKNTEQTKVDFMRDDLPRVCRVPYVPGKQVRYSFEDRPLSVIGRIKRKLADLIHHD